MNTSTYTGQSLQPPKDAKAMSWHTSCPALSGFTIAIVVVGSPFRVYGFKRKQRPALQCSKSSPIPLLQHIGST
jgi:hypothetical protein